MNWTDDEHERARWAKEAYEHRQQRDAKKAKPTAGSEPEWLERLREKNGTLIANQANAVSALDIMMPDHFAFDEMAQAAVLMKPLDDALDDPMPRPVRDADLSLLQNALQHVGFKRIGWDVIHRALEVISVRNRFHPVRDYL